jgi:hypothetical protein
MLPPQTTGIASRSNRMSTGPVIRIPIANIVTTVGSGNGRGKFALPAHRAAP